ncbi:WD-40 repeat-containing protein MSI4 [Citrus sinensis]|uniref:WD-40 repeat-containing protein MSI4 n=1 Tax=Citrus sinensis TaxID=2711 RepID=A0ACB8NTB3_CITSI|nr:WD-40 repeat-containing protein MSI4 [Citrus sinensis]
MDPQAPKKRGRKPKPKEDKKDEPKMKESTTTKRTAHQHAVDDKYTHWKSLVPVLYDWLANHNLVWPSLSCRWGPQLEQATYKNRQRLYLSEQTDGSVPNTLVIANCEVVKPRVAAAEHISQFNEEARSPFVKKHKTIIHPGEVNRIRELPQNTKIVATHTDSPDVLIWDVEAQPNRHAVLGATNSRPDLILTGHQDNAEFALAMCPTEPYVLSGGKDKSVVLWSIQDHITSSATDPATAKSAGSSGSIIKQSPKPGDGNDKAADGPSVGPRGIYNGHEDTVEDVTFCPSRSSVALVMTHALYYGMLELAQAQSLRSADNSVRMFDRRNLTSNGVGSPINKFEGHSAAVLCVQWSPDKSSVFGSSAEDGLLNIWDYEKVGKKVEQGPRTTNYPAGLFFQHAGHRDKVVDFHWNASDPWTVVSVSDDCDSTGGGGTLQIWRMSDLIYRPQDEVLAELEKFKAHFDERIDVAKLHVSSP